MRDFLLTTPYYVGIPLILWIICMGLFFFGFILFLIEAKKSELKSQKMINNITQNWFSIITFKCYGAIHEA